MGTSPGQRESGRITEFVATSPGRLDSVVAAAVEGLTRSRAQRLIASGAVAVNGEPARKSHVLEAGDQVTVRVEVDGHAGAAAYDGPEPPVLYEDAELVAIDKPPGLAVHGAPGDRGPSVAAWFAGRYPEAAREFDVERPGIVHRLDKDTSGVLLLAKTPAAQAAVSHAFEARQVTKTYLAVTDGIPAKPRAVIEAPIARHPGDRTRMAIAARGRAATTEYAVLGSGEGRALLLVTLHTGRTHQARVHLQGIATPVRFDRVYGHAGEGRQQLHAWRVVVPHPAGGRLTVTAPLPPDMQAEIRAIGLDGLASEYGQAAPAERSAVDEAPPGRGH